MATALSEVLDHLRNISTRVAMAAANGDLAAIRAAIDDYGALNPVVTAVDAQVIPADVDGVPGEWVCTDESDPKRRLLYIHGGSWMSGTAKGYRPHTARLARATGCSVLAIDYRLAPEHGFPAGLEDCVRSFCWMQEHGPAGARPAEAGFIAGDSAGGNLTLASLLMLKDRGLGLPRAAVAFSPATDLTWSAESFVTRAAVEPVLIADRLPNVTQAYLQEGAAPTDPYVSPLFGDFSGLPPLLVQVGDREILLDDSTRVAARARAAGCNAELTVWRGMPHVFQLFAPELDAARDALAEVAGFIQRTVEVSG